MRVVIDPDSLVSAYTVEGPIRASWQKGNRAHLLLISPEIFTAVETALRRLPRGLQPDEIRDILKDILKRSELMRPVAIYAGNMTDERDRPMVILAQAGGADAIVTEKTTLQEMKQIEGVSILSFSQLMER